MKPKYNIQDKIWMLSDNKAKQVEITGIRIGKTIGGFPTIFYGTNEPQEAFATIYIQCPEDEIFPSKEELLKSL